MIFLPYRSIFRNPRLHKFAHRVKSILPLFAPFLYTLLLAQIFFEKSIALHSICLYVTNPKINASVIIVGVVASILGRTASGVWEISQLLPRFTTRATE